MVFVEPKESDSCLFRLHAKGIDKDMFVFPISFSHLAFDSVSVDSMFESSGRDREEDRESRF